MTLQSDTGDWKPGIPTIVALGDGAVLVRFADTLSEPANRAAIALARRLAQAPPAGVREIQPNLVSVLVRYDPRAIGFKALSGELALLIGGGELEGIPPTRHEVTVEFGGEAGPDLAEVARELGLTEEAFIAAHSENPVRVLATGFAPGFVYCGFHGAELHLPRRMSVRRSVPAGSVLFAAGQTAIAGTAIPTGWHVIGRTELRNFDPARAPVTLLQPGDGIVFVEAIR